ncbi:MAG: hypothetical protein NTY03_03855, partial [Candidatus Bathyarchaeota archaeon]|nr:hypothetical protein [Candidatus Bathyarchaeota archaeon]
MARGRLKRPKMFPSAPCSPKPHKVNAQVSLTQSKLEIKWIFHSIIDLKCTTQDFLKLSFFAKTYASYYYII